MRLPALALRGGEPPGPDGAEASVLSAVLLDMASLDTCVVLGLRAEDFQSPENRCVYEAAIDLRRAKCNVDVVTVGTWLKNRDRLADLGGMAYLAAILSSPCGASLRENVATILTRSPRR